MSSRVRESLARLHDPTNTQTSARGCEQGGWESYVVRIKINTATGTNGYQASTEKEKTPRVTASVASV